MTSKEQWFGWIRVRSIAFLLAFLLGWVVAPAVWAQATLEVRDTVPLERLRLSTDRSGILGMEGAGVLEHLSWEAGLWLGWSSNPLIVYRVDNNERMGALVGNRIGAGLVGALGVKGWGQIGLEVPLVLFQDRWFSPGFNPGLPALSALGLGSLRLVPKVKLLSTAEHGLDLAVVANVTIPTGSGGSFTGSPGLEFIPEVALSRAFGDLRVLANVGAALRESRVLEGDTKVGSELLAHVGAGYRMSVSSQQEGKPLELALTLGGALSAERPGARADESALELRGVATYDVSGPWQVFLGAGRGLSRGWGTPEWRVFGGFRFAGVVPVPKDTDGDGDGLLDAEDACPSQAGPVENKGCPDKDSDGDGIIDRLDACPAEAGLAENQGCPDKDSDGDGIVDRLDACPAEAGLAENQGCPDKDTDGDGIVDRLDACPAEAGPAENKGCPDKDRDTDTVVDRLDECPDIPGPVDNKGCPKKGGVKLKEGRIEFEGTIYFDTDKDVIQQRSFSLLDNIATVIKAHPELGKIRVEGHTDNQGSQAHNMDLSQRRAEAVVRALVQRGVPAEQLTAQGFGPTRPVADNRTRDGRSKNRRVEFHIVSQEQESGAAPAPTGDSTDQNPN